MSIKLFGTKIPNLLKKMGLEFSIEDNDCDNPIGHDIWVYAPKGYEVNDCGEWLGQIHYTYFKNLNSLYSQIKYDFTHLRKENAME